MATYVAKSPISADAEKVLRHIGAEINGQEISHPDLNVGQTGTWVGAWRGYWMDVPIVKIGDQSFMDDLNYESFRLHTEAGFALAKSL